MKYNYKLDMNPKEGIEWDVFLYFQLLELWKASQVFYQQLE